MTREKLLSELESILEAAGTAVLATRDRAGYPHMRWMTPAFLRGWKDSFFALTSPTFNKVPHIGEHPEVEWMFQDPALTRIVNVRGKINLVNNPSIRSEVLEAVQPRLRAFWKVSPDGRDLVVLETVIEEATHYLPMKGTKESVRF